MTIEMLREFLLWCLIFNFGLLIFWFVFIALAGDFVYRLHSKFLPLSREAFNAIHYAGLAFFKVAIFLLVLIPYIALHMID